MGQPGAPAPAGARRAAPVDAAARGSLREPHRRTLGMTGMTAAAIAVDGGDLPLGGGLLALVRPALTLLEPDGVLAILSRSASASADLASWCRAERHEYLGAE